MTATAAAAAATAAHYCTVVGVGVVVRYATSRGCLVT